MTNMSSGLLGQEQRGFRPGEVTFRRGKPQRATNSFEIRVPHVGRPDFSKEIVGPQRGPSMLRSQARKPRGLLPFVQLARRDRAQIWGARVEQGAMDLIQLQPCRSGRHLIALNRRVCR